MRQTLRNWKLLINGESGVSRAFATLLSLGVIAGVPTIRPLLLASWLVVLPMLAYILWRTGRARPGKAAIPGLVGVSPPDQLMGGRLVPIGRSGGDRRLVVGGLPWYRQPLPILNADEWNAYRATNGLEPLIDQPNPVPRRRRL